MKKFGIFITAFLLISVFGCSRTKVSNENGYEKKRIVVGHGQTYTQIIMQTIRAKDLLIPYLPNDVTVEWSNLINVADIRDAAVSGRIDIFVLSASAAITAIENGLPVRIISNQGPGYAKMFSSKSQIKNVSDLTKNSRISVSSKGSTPHLMFSLHCMDLLNNAMIYDNGLVPVPDADAVALIQTSQDYDAYILSFPACYKIPDYVDYHLVTDLTPTSLKYNVGTYILTTDDFENNNPVIIEAFRKACEQAVYLLNNDTYETAVLLKEFYGLEPSLVADVIRQCPPKLEMSGYDVIADLMFKMGILSKPPKKFSELPNYNDIPK